MKKIIIILLIIITLLTGCKMSKEKITSEKFIEEMTEAGYSINDVTKDYSEFTKAYILAFNDVYQIDFVLTNDEAIAKNLYKENVRAVEESSSIISGSTTVTIGNYSKFTGTADGIYYVVSRIEDTFLYVKADKKHKDDIKEIVKKLGY